MGHRDASPTRHTVRSRDGTEIAFFRSGTGPPLVAVHGATTDPGECVSFVAGPCFQGMFYVGKRDDYRREALQ